MVLVSLNNIIVPSQHHIHVSVVNCTIPYSFYNINSSNNLLMYTVGGISKNVTIEPGNYNANQLCAYLTSAMPGFMVTYSIITNKIKFAMNMDFSFNSMSSCLEFMGIGTLNSSSGVLISSYCCNLQTVESINIQGSFNTGNFNSSNLTVQNILCNIVLNTNPNSMIVYESNGSKFTMNMFDNVLNEITLKVCDHNNQLIDLNNCNWNITLQLDMIDFVN